MGSISRKLIGWLMNKLKTEDMTITFGDKKEKKVIKITSKAIHKLFGFPKGDVTPPRPIERVDIDDNKNLKTGLGFDESEDVTMKMLLTKLDELVEIDNIESNNKAVKVFFRILFHKVVHGSSANRFSRVASMVADMNYEKMAQMDFCQVVVEEIKRAAEKWKGYKGPKGIKPIDWQLHP